MNEAVASGDLARVIRVVESLDARNVRPVVESSVCIGFKKGANVEILSWMANRIGTLQMSRDAPNVVRLSRVQPHAG
jgi:hypothetical protein